jgi:aminoglycoside 6'-N-acetyltransferase
MPAHLFRPFTRADLPLMREWRSRPHVIEWWGPPEVEDAEESLLDLNIAMWIVELAGRPFAYAQDYDPTHGIRTRSRTCRRARAESIRRSASQAC